MNLRQRRAHAALSILMLVAVLIVLMAMLGAQFLQLQAIEGA